MEHRLQFLLKQAEVFQHFAGTSLKKCAPPHAHHACAPSSASETHARASPHDGIVQASTLTPVRCRRQVWSEVHAQKQGSCHNAHKQKRAACRKGKRDRHNQEDEEAEDAELLADEEGEGEGATGRGHRLSVQPSVIKGGLMREYQIQGLNWLVHLYDNGINGILADEMVRVTRPLCESAWKLCADALAPRGGLLDGWRRNACTLLAPNDR